jgi:uncharacterized phage infection (PIP) family protein YhgE
VAALVALLLMTVAATGCGQSEAEKAQKDVCAARDDLHQQVDDLSNLTASTATVQGVQEKLSAIQADLAKVADARSKLSDERRQQVDQANEQFKTQLNTITAGLGTNISLSGAGPMLKQAAQDLANAYQQTYAKIDCG